MIRRFLISWAGISFVVLLLLSGLVVAGPVQNPYRSPFEVKYSPDGKWLAASDRTAGKLVVIDAKQARVAKEIGLVGEPAGVAWTLGGKRAFVSENSARFRD
ncbi:MAG: hypothetical protein ABSG14_14890 [Verrucomicrobiia bacterium]